MSAALPGSWILGAVRVAVVVALNLVPIWGFTQDEWSAGTTLALYWVQSLASIPITAVLIVMHRRATHKAGHYNGVTTISVNGGPPVQRRSTFLSGFLLLAIPFTLAHGVFLAVLLGLIWGKAVGGVDPEDLRFGVQALMGIMAVGFAGDVFLLADRPFAWIRRRAETLMQRMLVVHMAILIGMAVAVFASNDAAAFFSVFLVLKLLVDVGSEFPQWNPKEPPAWLTRMMNRIGGPGSDFSADWKKMGTDERAGHEADERRWDAGTR
jgi:hypothetical protein